MRRNYQKHTNANPLQRWLLERFHTGVAALVNEALGQTPLARILDAGCGEGFVIEFLRQGGAKATVVGLDADRSALMMAGGRGGNFIEGSATALPFIDASFPLVLCLEVMEHLEAPQAALTELSRVSAGFVIISVPNQPLFALANFLRGKNLRNLGEDPEHVHHWSAGQFLKLASRSMHVERVIYPFPWVLALCKKV